MGFWKCEECAIPCTATLSDGWQPVKCLIHLIANWQPVEPPPNNLDELAAALERCKKIAGNPKGFYFSFYPTPKGGWLVDSGSSRLITGTADLAAALNAIEVWCDEHETTPEQKQAEQDAEVIATLRLWGRNAYSPSDSHATLAADRLEQQQRDINTLLACRHNGTHACPDTNCGDNMREAASGK